MTKEVEEVIDFQNGKAELLLPKGATNVRVRISKNLRTFYLCATVDSYQTETEKYILASFDEKQNFTETDDFKFLKKILFT